MTSFRIRAAAPLLACAALFYSGFALRANYLVPHKENFRDSTTYLAAHSQPGDCDVVVPSGEDYHFHMAWDVYASGMPPLTFTPMAALEDRGCTRSWLISYTRGNFVDLLRLARSARKQLDARFPAIDRQSYFWIALDLYDTRRGLQASAAHSERMAAIKHSRLWSFLSIVAASVAFGFPLLTRGIPLGHDTLDHLQRYSCVAAQFWQGEVYPRWLARMNSGLGSPALFVYAPLPYFAPALLRPFLRLPVSASRESLELGISMWLAIALSGAAAYLWLRTMASRWAATAAAILYMAMPYHVVIDAYTRAAVAEMWPFVWMPLSLYFLSQILEGGFALAGAGLA